MTPRRLHVTIAAGLLVLTSACSPTTPPQTAPSTAPPSTAPSSPTPTPEPPASPTPEPEPPTTAPSGLWLVLTGMPATAELLDSTENPDGTALQGWQVSDQLALVISRDPAIAEASEDAVVTHLESKGSHTPQLQEVTEEFDGDMSYPAYVSFEESGDSNVYNLVILTDQWTFTVEAALPQDDTALELEAQLEGLLKSAILVEN